MQGTRGLKLEGKEVFKKPVSRCHSLLPFTLFPHVRMHAHAHNSRYDLIDLVRGHGSRDVGPQWDAIDPNTQDLTENACFASGW